MSFSTVGIFAALASGFTGIYLGYDLRPEARTTTTTTSTFHIFVPVPEASTVVCKCVCEPTPCSEDSSSSLAALASSLSSLAIAAAAGGGTTEVVRRRLRGKQSAPSLERLASPAKNLPVPALELAAAIDAFREDADTPSSLSRASTRPPTPPGTVTGPPITRATRLARQYGRSISSA